MSRIENIKGFIDFPSGFKLLAPTAVDSRFAGEDEEFLSSIVEANAAYPGLKVYIKSTNQFYSYRKNLEGKYTFQVDSVSLTPEQLAALNSIEETKNTVNNLEKRFFDYEESHSGDYTNSQIEDLIRSGDNTQALSVANTALEQAGLALSKTDGIDKKISSRANEQDKVITGTEAKEIFQNLQGRFLTKDSSGNSFESFYALKNSEVFYVGTEAILKSSLRVNDQAQVKSDETEGRVGKTTLYYYNGIDKGWIFRQVVNETSFTDEQFEALNSGITSKKLTEIEEDIERNLDEVNKEVDRATEKEEEILIKMDSDLGEIRGEIADTNSRVSQVQTLAGSANSIANIVKNRVDELESYLPSTVSTANKLVSELEVNSKIQSNAGRKISSSIGGNPFATVANLKTGPYYYAGAEIPRSSLRPTDSATVLADEDNKGVSTIYYYDGSNWALQSVGNASFTDQQLAAIDSGITKDKLDSIDTRIKDNSTRIEDEISFRAREITRVEGLIGTRISTHNTSGESHSDLRNRINSNEKNIVEVMSLAEESMTKANAAYSLAEGKGQAKTFKNLGELTSVLKLAPNTAYSVGTVLLIEEKGVPDYWIAEILTTNSGEFGYYRLCEHEGDKLDLSGYQKIQDNTLQTSSKTIPGAINELKTSHYDKEAIDQFISSLNQDLADLDEETGQIREMANSKVGSVSEGITPGSILVDGIEVNVKGLKSLAFRDGLTKSDIGLGNVLNIEQASKSEVNELNQKVESLELKVNSLEKLGQFVGSYSSYGSLPSKVSEIEGKYGVSATINDFATVRKGPYPAYDAESKPMELVESDVTCWSIYSLDGEGNIYWAYEFTYDTDITGKIDKILGSEDEIAVFNFDGNLKSSGKKVNELLSGIEEAKNMASEVRETLEGVAQELTSHKTSAEMAYASRTDLNDLRQTVNRNSEDIGNLSERINSLTVGGVSHGHGNITVLDSITSDKIDSWDSAEENAKDYTDLRLGGYAITGHSHIKNEITDFLHGHSILEISGLLEALGGKQPVGDYATKDVAKAYADAKDAAIEAARKAGQDAQVTASNAAANAEAVQIDLDNYRTAHASDYTNSKIDEIVADAKKAGTDAAAAAKTAQEHSEGVAADLAGYKTTVDATYAKPSDVNAAKDAAIAQAAQDATTKATTAGNNAKTYAEELRDAEVQIREEYDQALIERIEAIEEDYSKGSDVEEIRAEVERLKKNPGLTVFKYTTNELLLLDGRPLVGRGYGVENWEPRSDTGVETLKIEIPEDLKKTDDLCYPEVRVFRVGTAIEEGGITNKISYLEEVFGACRITKSSIIIESNSREDLIVIVK